MYVCATNPKKNVHWLREHTSPTSVEDFKVSIDKNIDYLQLQ